MNPIRSQKHWHCMFQLFVYRLDRHDHPHNNPEGMLGMPYQFCWVSKQFHVPVSPSPDRIFFPTPSIICTQCGGMHGHRILLQTDTVAWLCKCMCADRRWVTDRHSELHAGVCRQLQAQRVACVQTVAWHIPIKSESLHGVVELMKDLDLPLFCLLGINVCHTH